MHFGLTGWVRSVSHGTSSRVKEYFGNCTKYFIIRGLINVFIYGNPRLSEVRGKDHVIFSFMDISMIVESRKILLCVV